MPHLKTKVPYKTKEIIGCFGHYVPNRWLPGLKEQSTNKNRSNINQLYCKCHIISIQKVLWSKFQEKVWTIWRSIDIWNWDILEVDWRSTIQNPIWIHFSIIQNSTFQHWDKTISMLIWRTENSCFITFLWQVWPSLDSPGLLKTSGFFCRWYCSISV